MDFLASIQLALLGRFEARTTCLISASAYPCEPAAAARAMCKLPRLERRARDCDASISRDTFRLRWKKHISVGEQLPSPCRCFRVECWILRPTIWPSFERLTNW